MHILLPNKTAKLLKITNHQSNMHPPIMKDHCIYPFHSRIAIVPGSVVHETVRFRIVFVDVAVAVAVAVDVAAAVDDVVGTHVLDGRIRYWNDMHGMVHRNDYESMKDDDVVVYPFVHWRCPWNIGMAPDDT